MHCSARTVHTASKLLSGAQLSSLFPNLLAYIPFWSYPPSFGCYYPSLLAITQSILIFYGALPLSPCGIPSSLFYTWILNLQNLVYMSRFFFPFKHFLFSQLFNFSYWLHYTNLCFFLYSSIYFINVFEVTSISLKHLYQTIMMPCL